MHITLYALSELFWWQITSLFIMRFLCFSQSVNRWVFQNCCMIWFSDKNVQANGFNISRIRLTILCNVCSEVLLCEIVLRLKCMSFFQTKQNIWLKIFNDFADLRFVQKMNHQSNTGERILMNKLNENIVVSHSNNNFFRHFRLNSNHVSLHKNNFMTNFKAFFGLNISNKLKCTNSWIEGNTFCIRLQLQF